MVRVKSGGIERRRHQKWLEKAKGFSGRSKSTFKAGYPRVMKAMQYAYRSRKCFKRDTKSLWITRMSAGIQHYSTELNYSTFIHAMKQLGIGLDRKLISNLVVSEPQSFSTLVTLSYQK